MTVASMSEKDVCTGSTITLQNGTKTYVPVPQLQLCNGKLNGLLWLCFMPHSYIYVVNCNTCFISLANIYVFMAVAHGCLYMQKRKPENIKTFSWAVEKIVWRPNEPYHRNLHGNRSTGKMSKYFILQASISWNSSNTQQRPYTCISVYVQIELIECQQPSQKNVDVDASSINRQFHCT